MDERQVISADIAIVGGGLVGALTGMMLAQQRPDWRIVICVSMVRATHTV